MPVTAGTRLGAYEILASIGSKTGVGLPEVAARRMIRVPTTYSKTQYFIDRGTPRGTAYDQGMLLETALNQKLATGNLEIAVQFIPLAGSPQGPVITTISTTSPICSFRRNT